MADNNPIIKPLANDILDIQNFANSGPDAKAVFNISRERDNSLTKDNQVLLDRASMTPAEFGFKYGPNVTGDLDRLDVAKNHLRDLETDNRTINQSGIDAYRDIEKGLTTSVGGIAALGAGIVNKDLGTHAADLLNRYRTWREEFQSPEANRLRYTDSIRTQLDKQDNNNQYEKDKSEEGITSATLKQFGRDAVNVGARMIETPSSITPVVSEGIGSLLAAGPVSKGLGVIGSQVAKEATVTAAKVPVAIGLLEAGGSYTDIVNDVMARSHEDLLRTSSDYKLLIDQGIAPDEAKVQIANSAALKAAAIVGPLAAATGKLVAPFEENPLATIGVRAAIGDVGREGIEEGLQSLTQEVTKNAVLQQSVDPNIGILDNVGSATVQGAVAGALSAGVAQAPGLALNKAGELVKNGVKTVLDRNERLIADNEAASPVSAENVTKALDVATVAAPKIAENLQVLAKENNQNNENTDQFINRVSNAVKITPEDTANLPAHLQEQVAGTDNRFAVLAQMARVAASEDTPQEDRVSAGLFILDQQNKQSRLFNQDIPEFLDSIPDDRPEKSEFQQYAKILSAIENVPAINQAIQWAKDSMEISPDQAITPQTAQNVAGMALYTPSKINPELATQVLQQADTGNVTLSPEQRQVIQTSSSLVQAGQLFNQIMEKQEKSIDPTYSTDAADIVSENIADISKGPYKFSMVDHINRINQAAQSGDKKLLKQRLGELSLFARHMRNKARAHVQSFERYGEKVNYQRLGRNHQWLEAKQQAQAEPAQTHPNNANSLRFARRVYAEATAVANLANNMSTIYPEYGFGEVKLPPLDPRMMEPISKIKPTTQEAVQSVPEIEGKVDTSKVKEPASEAPKPIEPVKEEIPTQEQILADEKIEQEGKVERRKQEQQFIEPVTVNNQYPELVEPKGTNYFKEAYKLSKNAVSRLTQLVNPVKDIHDLLNNPKDAIDFANLDYKLTTNTVSAFQDYLKLAEEVTKEIKTRLVNEFAKKKDGSGKTLKDRLLAGEEVIRYTRGRMLNILDRTPTSFRYNPQLLESAVLAGLHWVLNAHQGQSELDRSEIAQIIGVDESLVTNEDVAEFNRGFSLDKSKRDLAAQIIKFWGVSINKNTSESYTKGIAEGMAAEVLYGLEAAGLIQLSQLQGNNKTFNRVLTDTRSDKITNLIENLNNAPKLLSDIALVEKQRDIHIGKPPTSIAQKQLRNPLVNNTRQQKQMIENEQHTPFYVNVVVHDFIKAIGQIPFTIMMGGINYEEGDLNINHQKSIDGINRTLMSSWANITNQVTETSNYITKDMPLEDVTTYYEYNVSKVGRLQMQGLNNPQSDKLAREIFMPTKTTLDMTNPEDIGRFWLTVGQGLGLKTEKLSRAVIQQKAQELTQGKYADIISDMEKWLDDQTAELVGDLSERIRSAMGNDISMHGVHSLLSVAQLNKSKDLKSFVHYNALEADGKTNGPIMSLMLLSTGKFTSHWLKLVAKGGMFLGAKNKTLNEHIKSEDPDDLYQEVASLFNTKLSEFLDNLSDNHPKMLGQFNSLLSVMSALNTDIKYDPNSNSLVLVQRGVTKNPLTITIYGSGIEGIAANVANELMNMMYEKLSNNENIFTPELNDLLDRFPVIKKATGEMFLIDSKSDTKNVDFKKFTFSDDQFRSFKNNIRIFFVEQLNEAIQEAVIGNVSESTSAIQRSTQVQSLVLKYMFHNEIIARLAKKKLADPKNSEFLSENELNQIYADLNAYSPLIETGNQNFFLSGSESSDLFDTTEVTMEDGTKVKVSMPQSFSRALDDTLSSPAYVYGPTEAGVSGVPSIVIGTGDGMIMQTASTMKNAPKGTLKVFDGMYMSASDIDESGRKVNEAVYQTILSNPMQNIADSFKAFLRNNPLETLLDEKNPLNTQMDNFIFDISKVIFNNKNPKELAEASEITEYLNSLSQTLDQLAEEVSIRQEVMAEFNMSVDQMASAEAPFTHEGITLDGDNDTKAQILNNRYDQKVLERNQTEAQRSAIEKANAELVTQVNIHAQKDDALGVQILSIDNAKNILPKNISDIHKEMFNNTLNVLRNSGYNIVFGNPEQLSNYQANNYPDRFDPNGIDAYGKIDTVTKTIYISNMATETVVHELIHAATIDKTRAYYNNKSNLSSLDQEAFARLEGLMNEWLLQNYDSEVPVVQETRRQAESAITSHLSNNRPAEALNEFMAWSLANQNLAEVQSKTKIKNKLYRIASDALDMIKKLIWGNKTAPRVNDTLFSNLRFNTRIIMSTPFRSEQFRNDLKDVSLYQSTQFGSSNYLSELRNDFANKIARFISNGDIIHEPIREAQSQQSQIDSHRLAVEFIAHGFPMDMQEASTFSMIVTAFMVDVEFNPASLTRIEDIYTHVMKSLSVESFMIDPDSTNPMDRFLAQEKYNVLNGDYLIKTDDNGRSTLMSSFLALSMVDEGFRDVLSKIEVPKSINDPERSVDAYLTNLGYTLMDSLSKLMSGEGRKNKNVQDALGNLTLNLMENVGDQRSFIEQQIDNGGDAIDNYLHEFMETQSENLANKAQDLLDNTNSPIVAGIARFTKLIANIINEKNSKLLVNGMTSALNNVNGLNTIREFLSEVIGRTEDNTPIFDMISKVRAVVQQTRQQFREKLPQVISSEFTRDLTDDEQEALHAVLGKSDLASLYSSFGIANSLELLINRQKLDNESNRIEAAIRAAEPIRGGKIIEKSRQLALYMNGQSAGPNFLRNAYAVAHLFGERTLTKRGGTVDQTTIDLIDQYTTLYALQETNYDISDLVNNQRKGVEFALNILRGTRVDELNKINNDESLVNHYKGWIPSENQLGTSLIVADDTEDVRLRSMGYNRIGPYTGSSADFIHHKSYYFTPVSGKATYNQGVLQTVHKTVSGIDPRTGYTTGEIVAGVISDPQDVRDIQRRLVNSRSTEENLLPIYDNNGTTIAYERSIDRNQTARLNQNTNLSQMIGAWKGRQAEEHFADEFNKVLVNNLHTIWVKGQQDGRRGEFINLSGSNDPIHKDAWKLIPKELKDYIKATYGNGFYIRKDMINDAVGFRSASIGDLWTGNTRLPKNVQKDIKNIIMNIYGGFGNRNNTYSSLVTGEKFIQNLVSNAKVLIVVKSLVVPIANMFSNVFQLLNRGIPARDVIKGLGTKTTEINDYVKRRDKELLLDAHLLNAKGANDLVQIRKLETELRSIRDSYKRMSIYPLIQAGEFSAISDGGITQEDLALANGRWATFIENVAAKLPDGLNTVARNALITRDTALFHGLTRSVQYGDFIAKAIMYDHLTKNKKMNNTDAIGQLSEAFVNYNRQAGRVRNYAESMGLIWFWNFKIRSMKEAVYLMRHHPFRSLMVANMVPAFPLIGSIGNPTTDNFASILWNGKLGWSMGPGMGLNAPQMNPFLNAFE